jgi:hypothetical protein
LEWKLEIQDLVEMGNYMCCKHFEAEKVLENIGPWASNSILAGCGNRFGIGEVWGAWYCGEVEKIECVGLL